MTMKVLKPNVIPEGKAAFSRASAATFVNDAGVVETVAADVPRYERGRLLVEAAATNLISYSRRIGGPGWSSGRVAITLDAALAPNGLAEASFIAETEDLGSSYVSKPAFTFEGGFLYVASVYAKYGGGDRIRVQLADINGFSGGPQFSEFNLQTGTRVSGPGGIEAIGDGWYRCWHVRQCITTNTASWVLLGFPFEQNDPTKGHYFWGAQVERVALSSYVPTAAAVATREADVVGSAGLLTSTAVESHASWAVGVTYTAGDRRVRGTGLYESLAAGNTGNDPAISPTWWTRIGPSNTWAMFDDQVSTQTRAQDLLQVAIATGIIDSVAILNVHAQSARLVVADGPGGPVIYDQTQSMAGEEVASWYEYFFNDPTTRRGQAVFTGIPPFSSSVATLSLTSAGDVEVGNVAFGRTRPLGKPFYGARAGITDFSRKDTDDFGTTTFVRRAYSKTLQLQIEVDNLQVNRVQRLLYDLRATPVVWLGSNRPEFSEPLVVFGFYKDFYCAIEYATTCIYSLEIEGLI